MKQNVLKIFLALITITSLPMLVVASGGDGALNISVNIVAPGYNLADQKGNGAFSTSGNSISASASSGATAPDSQISLGFSYVLNDGTYSGVQIPTAVTIVYSLNDLASDAWYLGGYNPPDPNGSVSGYASVGQANIGFSIIQGISTNYNAITTEAPTTNPYNNSTTLATSWIQLGQYYYGLNSSSTVASGQIQAVANYSTPAHYSWFDFDYAGATETFGVVSATPVF